MENEDVLVDFFKVLETECGAIYTKENLINPINYNSLTKKGKYLCDVFWKYMEISNIKADLILNTKLIESIKPYKLYKNIDTDSYEILRYHTEHYFYKIYTFLELMKLSINTVYEIGLKEKECTWENLRNNKKIKGSKAYKIIDDFYNDYKSVLDLRHFNVHRNFEIVRLEKEEGLLRVMHKLYIKANDCTKESQQLLKMSFSERKKEVVCFMRISQTKIDEYTNNFLNIILKEAIYHSASMQ